MAHETPAEVIAAAMTRRRPRAVPEPPKVTGHTLVEVVDRYLRELANPAPDYGQRQMYREWMRELVDAHKAQETP